MLWKSGLTSRPAGGTLRPPAMTVAYVAVAQPASVAIGIDSGWGPEFGWAGMDVNWEDPSELELAVDLNVSAISHVTGSTCNTYSCQFNMFVYWCASLAVPRAPLPASDATVALYLQSVVNRTKPFAPVKAVSATIAFYQRVNLFDQGPRP